eukprot:scaffold568_cov93-Skeletonema_marinoi.AAC.5
MPCGAELWRDSRYILAAWDRLGVKYCATLNEDINVPAEDDEFRVWGWGQMGEDEPGWEQNPSWNYGRLRAD